MAVTLNTKINWIHSFSSKSPAQTKYKGRWMAYLSLKYADSVWKKIDVATKADKLGFHSKMSSPIQSEDKKRMYCTLCIYTYDCYDSEDVLRVREELRKLGFVSKMNYVCKRMYHE